MIIVSQDKMKVINFDKVNYIDIDQANGIFRVNTNFENKYETVGKYKTEERAKEVLEDLLKKMNSQKYLLKPKANFPQKTIEATKRYFEKINEIDLIVDNDNFEILPIGNNGIIIYKMPED